MIKTNISVSRTPDSALIDTCQLGSRRSDQCQAGTVFVFTAGRRGSRKNGRPASNMRSLTKGVVAFKLSEELVTL